MQIITIGEQNKDIRKFLETLEGKNINFLFGAGASMPYLKGLNLEALCGYTFEDIMNQVYLDSNEKIKNYISAYFIHNSLLNGTYKNIIESKDPMCISILNDYMLIIESLYKILQRNSIQQPKRVNVFSTNYDMFFECAFDKILASNPNLYFNDGSYGFVNKYVNTQRFHMKLINVGVDNRYEYELPMFNLIKLHGSLNWWLNNDKKIAVDNFECLENLVYNPSNFNLVEELSDDCWDVEEFINTLDDHLEEDEFEGFYKTINRLAIVRPTKRKFYDTVFEEHFFQSLRLLTQELERKQSVLIVFGFSFNDEHIFSIIKRSLLNPNLLLYIICYDEKEKNRMEELFHENSNVLLCINKTSIGNGKGDFKFLISLLGGTLK